MTSKALPASTVEVVQFPKPCPHCSMTMQEIKQMYTSWLECYNPGCLYLTTQTLEKFKVDGVEIEDVPVAFKYGVKKL